MSQDNNFSQGPVPQSARKGVLALTFVMLGLTFFSASMWTGGTLGTGLSYHDFFLAVLIGNLLLGIYTSFLGYIGAKTGLTTHLLARFSFGVKGSWLPSLLLGGTQVGWFGVGVAMFSIPVGKATGLDINLLIAVSGLLMTVTVFFGISALTVLSVIAVPAIACLGGYSVWLAVNGMGDLDALKAVVPAQPLDFNVALALVAATYANGYVKNKVMEFVGPGVANLSADYRNGIDVMTTETTCWSSIWQTDDTTKEYFVQHGRPEAYKELKPADVAYYDGCIELDLSTVECMIALPMHPSYAYPIRELKANAKEILQAAQDQANRQLGGKVEMDLVGKICDDGRIYVDQGVVAGCSGGTYENICAVADIIKGKSCGNGEFKFSVYPDSMPTYLELVKNGAVADIVSAGGIFRECFCGPCFGAGDTPANGEFSIRHTTRNFPNREGSKPGEGQISAVALMDARSIAATAANGGYLTAASELTDVEYTVPDYHFEQGVYDKRVYNGWGHPEPDYALKFGPNIKDWPEQPALTDDLLVKIVSYITDPVTTTDELIPSGETSSFRSNPLRLAEFTLSRKDPAYVPNAKAVKALDEQRKAGELPAEVARVYDDLKKLGYAPDAANTNIGSAIFANKPGDGSAREQAASCQRVLGGAANFACEYATKRYRSNCINWGMLPFLVENPGALDNGDYVYLPGVRKALLEAADELDAVAVKPDGGLVKFTVKLGAMTDAERRILADGCLINYYKNN